MKKRITIFLFILTFIFLISYTQASVRCYYDGDGDLYGDYNNMIYSSTNNCEGLNNRICSPETFGANPEDCAMVGFDCDDNDETFNERCQSIYCYKDLDQDNYVMHEEYYMITSDNNFYSSTRICEPNYTDEENVASEEDDCNDNNPHLTTNCNPLINPHKRGFINKLGIGIIRYFKSG